MHRRDVFRSLFFRTSTAKPLIPGAAPVMEETEELKAVTANGFKSTWHALPGAGWTAAGLHVDGLKDWSIKDGELNCIAHGANRMAHLLTHQLCAADNSFKVNFIFRFLNQPGRESDIENFAGFRLGLNVIFRDGYPSTHNDNGIDAGVTRNGYLFIGKTLHAKKIDEKILTAKIRLQLSVTPLSTGGNFAKFKALDASGNTIATLSTPAYDAIAWQGNIALVSHFSSSAENTDQPTIAISKFEIEGEKITLCPENNPISTIFPAFQNSKPYASIK